MTAKKKSVLYVGQAYYNHWYLSREMRKLGWKADQLNLDRTENSNFFHGQDIAFYEEQYSQLYQKLNFYLYALDNYEIFHFANTTGINFINDFDTNARQKKEGLAYSFFTFLFDNVLKWKLNNIYRLVYFLGIKRSIRWMQKYKHLLPERWDILLIKKIGKKIVYTNNGCHDGLLQTTFAKWSTPDNISICGICPHKDDPTVCSDEKMKKWGEFRNAVCDYQCLLGGNRADYNVGTNIHEVPEVYCLDTNFWRPDLLIPTNYKLPIPASTVKIYHSVGNYEFRSHLGTTTIKSTHIYIPLIEKLKRGGNDVEMIFFNDVPNKKLRYYQAQADIVVDMLTYGFFGANIREAMMLGKPCVCYLRPEWLEQMKAEIPDYVAELPIVNADPTNIETVLMDLISNKAKREEIGRKSREFAVKWHSSEVGAKRFERIYSKLIGA
jgi:glycosyltransferase involved in cell wall biosynthesis